MTRGSAAASGSARWSLAERAADLARAEREGVDLLVVGGGITGAGVLRDAASRGLRSLLVERSDFASGTSGRSSKLVHGGLRYIGEGQLGLTRRACRERDRLLAANPHLLRPLAFLLPAYDDSKRRLWQVRAALWTYAALASFRRSSRFEMLRPEQALSRAPDLRSEGLRGAGLYGDARVDDARLVLETLKSARALGGAAVNHAAVVEFLRHGERIRGARVRDALAGRDVEIRARVVVNAAGPAVERVRGLDAPIARPELRPAKGIHLVIPRHRVRTDVAVAYAAADGRHLFVVPWEDMLLLGTSDSFTDEIDEPVVTIGEVHYLLSAANDAFPQAGLTTNDLCSVFAGVRPLAAEADEDKPPSSVSREERIYRDHSGLVSAMGGKLTTYRATGERIVDRVVRQLPPARRAALGPSRTAGLPLRFDEFDRAELESELNARFDVAPWRAAHLVTTYGAAAATLLERAAPELRAPIGASRYTLAEIPWSFETECPASLCDLLERRLRMAIWSAGQGLPELAQIAALAAQAAGWDAERTRAEARGYAAAVRRRYQIVAAHAERSAA
jgi:glycerol-3-phosphate dehydrogenase